MYRGLGLGCRGWGFELGPTFSIPDHATDKDNGFKMPGRIKVAVFRFRIKIFSVSRMQDCRAQEV